MTEEMKMNLQLFGEGGAGAGGDGGQAAPTGGTQQTQPTQAASSRNRRRESSLANVVYGRQDGPQVASAAEGERTGRHAAAGQPSSGERNGNMPGVAATAQQGQPSTRERVSATSPSNLERSGNMSGVAATAQQGQPRPDFEQLIKGEYKSDFEKRVQGIVNDRLKNSRAQEAAVAPILDMLAQRYGLETDESGKLNLKELGEKLAGDTSYLESEAAEKGLPTEVVQKLHTLEHLQKQSEREQRKQEMQRQFMEQQQKVRGHFDDLQRQAAEVQKLYPNFDLSKELANKAFVEMTKPGSNVDVLTAYRALHHDELAGAEMQYAVEKSAQKISASVAANGRRPAENGLGASVAVTNKTDPASLGRDDLKEIRKRVARGEKIRF